jgi:hypothetical protein
MKSIATLFPWMVVLLFALAAPSRGWSTESRQVSISNARLRVTLATPSRLLAVDDLESGVDWVQYVPSRVARGRDWGKVSTREILPNELVQIEQAVARGRKIQAEAVWRGHPFQVVFELAVEDPVLTVTIDTPDREEPLPWKPGWAGTMLMTYPYAFYDEAAGAESVVPVDEGLLYSTREIHTTADPRRFRPWWLHQKLSMPWWGVTSGDAGVMTQVDTPYDCMFSIQWVNTPAGQRTLPQVTWIASKRCQAYPRRVAYHFVAEGGYVAMAKAFRRTQQAGGAFRSWEEKIRTNPAVERLRGALDLWSQVDITPQMIKGLREAGIQKAIIAKCRGGDPTPAQGIQREAIRAANEAGYLIGGYHNYSWIQGRWIERDPALKDAAVMQADGTFKSIANAWDAKGRLDRCPATHRSIFIEKAQLTQALGVNYFFTDCTTTGGSIQECYHPQHALTRRAGADHLNEALQGLGDLGLIVGSERGKWWATPTTHVFEGIETLIEYGGSYYGSGNDSHWVGPYLESKPGYRELCLGFDFNPARRVPLFQLVYHDSVYCTRRWNQDPGRDASLWKHHDLMNVLYGTPPLWFMHPKAGNVIGTPEWEHVKDRYLQTYQKVCRWHEKVGFDEMTDHRFLSDDRLVQETRFSSGWTVVVNFHDQPWNDPRGFQVPPHRDHAFME